MSAWLYDSVEYEDGIVGTLFCDAESDIPSSITALNLPLKKMSMCRVIGSGNTYQLNSAGTWVLQPKGNSVSLDLTGYYTAAEVDQAIADGIRAFITGDDIPANYDLNDFVAVGHRNCAAVNANSCANRPLGSNQTGGFGVTNSLIYTTSGTTDKVKQEVVYNVTGNNLARNRTFWRYYSSAGWSDWYEVTTTVVTLQQLNNLQQPSLLMGTQPDTE